MTVGLHNLQRAAGSKQRRTRVGRGTGSGLGTYSGRGQKGQRSRSGGRSGLKRRGLQTFLHNKPKLGGFKSLKPKMATISLSDLERHFEAGEVINAKKLLAKAIVRSVNQGVKVLGDGTLTKKLTVVVDAFSASAKAAIEKAGGVAQVRGVMPPKKK